MVQKVQIKRTATPNLPPTGLSPGELAIEMDTPTRLWVGVPAAQDASLRKLLIDATNLHEHGRCRLLKEGFNLVLRPRDGNTLWINNRTEIVPDAGVTLLPGGTVNAINYIYAYMNAGAMALEIATAAHSRDPLTGVEIKTGDPTRTLVGMAWVKTGPAFVDTERERFVRTWFNDHGISAVSVLPVAVNTTAGGGTILHADWNIAACFWDNEIYDLVNAGMTSCVGGNTFTDWTVYTNGVIGWGGIADSPISLAQCGDANWTPYTTVARLAEPAGDRMHFFTPNGYVNGGAPTGYWGKWTATNSSCIVSVVSEGHR